MGEPATPGLRAYLRAQAREQRRLLAIRPAAPPALRSRLWRWAGAALVRELAWQLSLLNGTLLALLGAAGAFRRRLGRTLGLALGSTLLVQLRHAIAAHRSVGAVEKALADLPDPEGPRMPLSHVALPPLTFFARNVSRERGVVYAEPDGRPLRLDVYRSREPAAGSRPAVIQVHGGGWIGGSRLEQGVPLLNHLASLGWTGFNIDYRLSPEATWPDHIEDVKSAIAWVRGNAPELGVDPGRIAITGGSAGGHLAALAALTANDPSFQPGFEAADTSVFAAVPFYGIYDLTDAAGHYYPHLREWAFERVVIKRRLEENADLYRAASPRWRVHPNAPPFMIVHGERDTLVPVDDARDFARELARVSANEVRYVELPGAEHAFDLWPSVRTARAAEGVGRFLTAVATREPSRHDAVPTA